MEKTIKIILKIFLILMYILILVGLIMCYKMYREEKERKEAARIGYTEYDLDSYYVIDLYWYLDICPPEFRGSFDENLEKYKYRLEKKNLKLEAGEYTEEIIEELNNLMFNDPLGAELKLAATEHGFSENNPITLEWILTNPVDICKILDKDRWTAMDVRREVIFDLE